MLKRKIEKDIIAVPRKSDALWDFKMVFGTPMRVKELRESTEKGGI